MIIGNKNDDAKTTPSPSTLAGQNHKVEEKKEAIKPAFAGKVDEQTVVGDKKSVENSQSPAPQKRV